MGTASAEVGTAAEDCCRTADLLHAAGRTTAAAAGLDSRRPSSAGRP